MTVRFSASLTNGALIYRSTFYISVSGIYFYYTLSKPQDLVLLEGIGKLINFSFLFEPNNSIQFNSILYYLCAESTATRPITDTAQYRYT
jgi:hypothetical protein